MPKPPRLLVIPNPFCALDRDGDPSGVYPRVEPGLNGLLIGARLSADSTDDALKYFFETDRPVELPDLPAYRKALRDGDLLCADEATAKVLGLAFVEPRQALALAEQKAAAQWRADHGEDPPFVPKEREGAATSEPRTEVPALAFAAPLQGIVAPPAEVSLPLTPADVERLAAPIHASASAPTLPPAPEGR